LVASLVCSQGASIYSPLEDQFEDRHFPGSPYGIIPLVPYSQDYVAVPPAAPYATVPLASQSPIFNINPEIVVPAPEMAALTFTNYETEYPQKFSLESTDGDVTVVMRFQANERNDPFPSFTYGRLLNHTFILEKTHYHLGHDEFHKVYYNSKYDNFDEATKHRDGIAVLFVFVEIPSKQDNDPFQFANKIFHPECINVTFLGKPLSLEDLLPNEADNLNHYFGSLTTPRFNEVVTWTFLDNHIALFLNGST